MFSLGTLSGLNWYKWGAIAVVLIALCTGSYFAGKHRCEAAHQKEAVALAQKQAAQTIENVTKRLPEIQIEDKKAAVKKAAVVKTGEKLHESIQASGPASGCKLSPEQLRYFQELAAATKH